MTKALDGVAVHSVRLDRDGHYCTVAGVASLDGRGLALAVGRPDRRGCRIEVYGADSRAAQAERSLDGLVEQWRNAGRPSLANWQITMTYEVTRSAAGAHVANTDGCFTAVRWPS